MFGHPKRRLSVSPRGFITPRQVWYLDQGLLITHTVSSPPPPSPPPPAMNTPNGPAQVKKQEDSDDSPQKSGSKLDAKPASRTLNRVPRTYSLLNYSLSSSRSHTPYRCLRV